MRYRENLNQARANTSRNFFAANQEYEKLINLICESTFSHTLIIEKKVTLNKYQHALLASFVRSTAVSVELITTSELIEAVTILRKQVELLARLYELEEKEFEKLSGKTPNIRGLKTKLKRLYSGFSESAHSATYGSMSLIGFYKDTKRREHIFYPEFTPNTEVIFQNWISIFWEFTFWAIDFKIAYFDDYDHQKDEEEFMEIFRVYQSSGLDQKFKDKYDN